MDERDYWLSIVYKITEPVLDALANKKLKELMPVENKKEGRGTYTYLEALGRTLQGIAPWLESTHCQGEEERIRLHYAELSRKAIDAGTDPASPDFMNFSRGDQPIVDAAFLAHAILRAPNELWMKLDSRVRANVVQALKSTKSRKPYFNNWLLFSAMIETVLYAVGEDWDPMRVDYALQQHEQWYKGDGMYGDGPDFHWDYYNSFVIHPMLIDIVETLKHEDAIWHERKPEILKRARRYASIQERLISPEGTFPAIGRSLAYRFGVFHLLSQMALRRDLPAEITPLQVRSALTKVIRRMIEMPDTFDTNGWLTIGFCGSQRDIGESYISTGSLYLCTSVFLPLGLSRDDEFWLGDFAPWTSVKAWSGNHFPIDEALDD